MPTQSPNPKTTNGKAKQSNHAVNGGSPDLRLYHMGSLDVAKFEMDSGVKIRRGAPKASDEPAPPNFD